MKFWPVYKKYTHKRGATTVWSWSRRLIYLPLVLIIVLSLSLFSKNLEIYAEASNNFTHNDPLAATNNPKKKNKKTKEQKKPKDKQIDSSFKSVITTIFWVGETASSDNNFISNTASAWVADWQKSYGGVDNPDNRSGYQPAGFKPKENPFYFALPYSDITDAGERKDNAKLCSEASSDSAHSWCKNSWIEIKSHGRTVYAQWEDVGPYEADDYDYVFGHKPPKNKIGAKAGLDVSPAVRDYLKLADVDKCSWRFISASKVPAGPWKKMITTSSGYKISL